MYREAGLATVHEYMRYQWMDRSLFSCSRRETECKERIVDNVFTEKPHIDAPKQDSDFHRRLIIAKHILN